MRLLAGLVALAICGTAAADDQMRQVQRALIQRDQQSAEFAAQVRGQDVGRLQRLHAGQLRDALQPMHVDPGIDRGLMPYQRERMAQERELVFPPPVVRAQAPEPPLPLPGGLRHGVDPIPVQGTLH
ncbi:MAG: hypothetical protein ACREVB_00570 [Burkholderiales bacterium]